MIVDEYLRPTPYKVSFLTSAALLLLNNFALLLMRYHVSKSDSTIIYQRPLTATLPYPTLP